MKFSLKSTRLGLRNSTTRLPFRYGQACLTHCPQAVLEVTLETNKGWFLGYAGDCLPPGWFDKSPEKDFQRQIQEMLLAIRFARSTFLEVGREPETIFEMWQTGLAQVHEWGEKFGCPPLLSSFAVSLVERAMMDGAARALGISFARAVKEQVYGLRPEAIASELSGHSLTEWLPDRPLDQIFVRHTVGLGDPLTHSEIQPTDHTDDGLPHSLEEYIQQTGTRYFKIKVSNSLDKDLHRLRTIASLIENHRGEDYRVTLDGNEQYRQADQFDELIDSIESDEPLQTLWKNTLLIEQPLERSIALDEQHTTGIRDLGTRKAVIIDESDGHLDSFQRALELGYRGVSSKNCKGPIKSIINAGLVWKLNQLEKADKFVISGEDLCTVGVVPTQADLCLVAMLGVNHVERNGHHYHRGLSYLSSHEQNSALASHGDLYARLNGIVTPRIDDGRFHIGSLQCPGFGFSSLPDFDCMTLAEDWEYASLFD